MILKGDWERVDREWGDVLPVMIGSLTGLWEFRPDGTVKPSARPAIEAAVDARRHREDVFWLYLGKAGLLKGRDIYVAAGNAIKVGQGGRKL